MAWPLAPSSMATTLKTYRLQKLINLLSSSITMKISTILGAVTLLLFCILWPRLPGQYRMEPQVAPRAAASSPLRPHIFFTDVETGPTTGGPGNLGIPISIFGKGFGAARGNSRVTIGGTAVASYLVWGAANAHNKDLDMIVVQPGALRSGGPIEIIVDGASSNLDHSFTPTPGHIYYLSPNGSDAHSCSESSPCATVGHVVPDMKTGDALLLRGGAYSEGEIWIRAPQGGAPNQPKTIKNYPGENPVLGNAKRDFYIDADYVTVSGLNFQNGKSLLVTGWATLNQRGARFINNTFSGVIAWAAIDITGHDHLVAGNVCDLSGSTVGTMGHCYYVTQGTNSKILYNVASGAPGYGLHIYDERRADKDFQRVISNLLVEGNILRGSRQRSGMVLDMSDAGNYGNRIENVTIRNNIFYENDQAGLVIKGSVRGVSIYSNTFYQNGRQSAYIDSNPGINGVDIRNNLFYQSRDSKCSGECEMTLAHLYVGTNAQHVTVSGNSYCPGRPMIFGVSDSNPTSGEVSFANADAEDFHLLPGSSAIGHGAVLPVVLTDHDGRPRPSDHPSDIGAYEY